MGISLRILMTLESWTGLSTGSGRVRSGDSWCSPFTAVPRGLLRSGQVRSGDSWRSPVTAVPRGVLLPPKVKTCEWSAVATTRVLLRSTVSSTARTASSRAAISVSACHAELTWWPWSMRPPEHPVDDRKADRAGHVQLAGAQTEEKQPNMSERTKQDCSQW